MRRLLLFGAVCGTLLLGPDNLWEASAAAVTGLLCALVYWLMATPVMWAFGAIRNHRPLRVVSRTRGTMMLAGAITLFVLAVLPDMQLSGKAQLSIDRFRAGAQGCQQRHGTSREGYAAVQRDAEAERWAQAVAEARAIEKRQRSLRACMDRVANAVARDGQLAPHARDVVDGMHWYGEGWSRAVAALARHDLPLWSQDPDMVAGVEQMETAYARIEAIRREREAS